MFAAAEAKSPEYPASTTPSDVQSGRLVAPDDENAAAASSHTAGPQAAQTLKETAGSPAAAGAETTPRFPWQVSRKHVYAKMASSANPNANAKQTAAGGAAGVAAGTRAPSVLSVARTFEARHRAQQQMLSEQLRLIREQQALIEQLKCEQTRALVSQEQHRHALQDTLVAQLERIQTRLEQIDVDVAAASRAHAPAADAVAQLSDAAINSAESDHRNLKTRHVNIPGARATRSNSKTNIFKGPSNNQDTAKQANGPVVVDLGAAQPETVPPPSSVNGDAPGPEPDTPESQRLHTNRNVSVPREKRKVTDFRTAEDIDFLKSMLQY